MPLCISSGKGREMGKVFVQDKLRGEVEKEIRHLACVTTNIPLVKVPAEKLNQMVGHNRHQGVVATISPIPFHRLEDVIPHLFQQGKQPFFIVLRVFLMSAILLPLPDLPM